MTSQSASNEQVQNYKKSTMYKFTSKILKNYNNLEILHKECVFLNAVLSS